MTAPILNVTGLVKRFGGLLATDHVDITVKPGEIHALIGPNGAGKTTLISQLMGEIKPNEGRIEINGQAVDGLPTARRVKLGLARTFQISCLLPDFTVRENVALAVQVRRGSSFRFLADASRDEALFEEAMTFLRKVDLERCAGGWSPISRTAIRSSSSLPWHSRRSRNCCCWTSRWRGLG